MAAKPSSKQPSRHREHAQHPWKRVPKPTFRSLKVYGIDPSAGSYVGNRATIEVPWEELEPGPIGRKIAVIDYDAANRRYYHAVDLDDPYLVAADGLEPSESDPRFHQQMVYAVASQIIEMFEAALGREVHWRRGDRTPPASGVVDWDKVLSEDIKTLFLFPMR